MSDARIPKMRLAIEVANRALSDAMNDEPFYITPVTLTLLVAAAQEYTDPSFNDSVSTGIQIQTEVMTATMRVSRQFYVDGVQGLAGILGVESLANESWSWAELEAEQNRLEALLQEEWRR